MILLCHDIHKIFLFCWVNKANSPASIRTCACMLAYLMFDTFVVNKVADVTLPTYISSLESIFISFWFLMLTLMCTFAANRKASMASKLRFYAPIILHVVLDIGFLFRRQWGCFFLNSEQNSVLECNLLLKLDLLTIHNNEKCLHVCYIYIYIWKVQKEEQKEVLSWKLDWITSWGSFQPEFSYGLSEVAYKY